MGMTGNRASLVLAFLGVLAIVAKGLYIHPSEPAAMESVIGLTAGIFLLGFAWSKAGGRFVPSRIPARSPGRLLRR